MSEQDIKDIIVALIQQERLCAYDASTKNAIPENAKQIIEMHKLLKAGLKE